MKRSGTRATRAAGFMLGLSGLMMCLVISLSDPASRVATASPGPKPSTNAVLAQAMTFTVMNTNDSGPDSLRQAIIDANANPFPDTINVALGVTGTITLLTALPEISDDVTINGPGANLLNVQRSMAGGTPIFRIFKINSGKTVAISGVTMSNGNSGGSDSGGGIRNEGSLTINNSTISGNTGLSGGGIFNFAVGGTATVTLNNSTVSANSVSNSGGGILTASVSVGTSTVTINNSTISGNSAVAGGGILNAAFGIGSTATVTVSNSTISGNSATHIFSPEGGGILNDFPGQSTTVVNIKNSIVANSPSGGDCTNRGIFNASGVNFSTVGGCPGFNLVTPAELNLGPLQNEGGPTETHALLSGSVAIDAVTDCTDVAGNPITQDQRGVARPIDGDGNGSALCDAGAYEAPACTITCPANQTANTGPGAAECCTPVSYPVPTVPSPCGTVVCSPPSGSCYPVGTTTVTCGTGPGGSTCNFTVTVTDTTPPVINCPMNQTVAADANCQAVATYTASATDNCTASPAVTCAPASGSTFPKGTTTVTCTATDGAGNTAICNFTVTVNDTQPPSITCPGNITSTTATCPPSSGGTANFTVTASDNCPGVTTVCRNQNNEVVTSGSSFPVGTTTVTCTATDSSGNTASCSFTATVFNGCLQDDSNPTNVVLFNAQTGEYRFCCGGTTLTGTGTLTVRGCLVTIQQNGPDRRVLIKFDGGVKAGSASLQFPVGTTRCTITDRNTTNNSCVCQ